MPTPLALSLGVAQPGGDFASGCVCGSEELPIFIVSGRNVKQPGAADPFGDERSHVPTLGVAYVKVGDGLSSQELIAETVTDAKRKRAVVKYERVELNKIPLPNEPLQVRDTVVHFQNNAWVQAVKARMNRTQSQTVTIFVHGYNTDFIENTLLAGEIYHYMGRKGVMMSFEWPSADKLLGYVQDKTSASFSTRQFRGLISNIAKECDVDTITIIAHSAGAPIVVNALREIRLLEYDTPGNEVQDRYRVGRVVLAAPDMDVMEFTNAIHDRFYELTTGVAVYGSLKDRALKASERLSGSSRLGHAVGELDDWDREVYRKVPKIEMIDASKAEQRFRSFIGHSYFHRDPWVSSDIGSFLLGRTPEQRGLTKAPNGSIFWQFDDDYPERLKQLLGLR